MTDKFLDKVYTARGSDETRRLYDDWAQSYDAELTDNGYATPARCAEALARVMPDRTQPILDMGCGTGLSGEAFAGAGFTAIDGRDLSAGMLEKARAKGVYRTLATLGADDPLPEGYAAIAAVGVIGVGAAPVSLLDRIVAALPKGGLTVFSFNDHALEDPAYAGKVDALTSAGVLREILREHGPHIPARGLGATVFVLEKT